MPVTITDPADAAALATVRKGVAVCGPDGVVLGRFVPLIEVEFPQLVLTSEELARRQADPDGYYPTPDATLERLRALRKDA